MTTETNRHSPSPSPNAQSDELRGSDFFPPGTGWNQTDKKNEADDRKDAADKSDCRDKH